jgi:hypothetical protein
MLMGIFRKPQRSISAWQLKIQARLRTLPPVKSRATRQKGPHMTSRRHIASRLLLLLAVVPLASCNTAAVEHSYMSLDSQGDRRRTVFYTDTDTIYCIGELAIGRKDVSVEGAFRATALAEPPTGDLVPTDTVLAVQDTSPDATGSDIVVAFQLIKTADPQGPWPAGKFACDLSIDGELEASVPFEIQYPACPFQPPSDGDQCAGFFLPQSQCAGADAAQSCVCSEAGVWRCS